MLIAELHSEPKTAVLLRDLHYDLPPELIAQRPAEPRDASRLLVLHRDSGRIEHRTFCDILDYFAPGDGLVLNNTRVIPARFFCRRRTGGKVEALFLRAAPGPARPATDPQLSVLGSQGPAPADEVPSTWQVLLRPSARLWIGERLRCEGTEIELVLTERHERGQWTVHPEPPVAPFEFLGEIGQPPLPPYIRPDAAGRHGAPDEADRERYQTVYAQHPGAVAAPTAGLHFTRELLHKITSIGVRRVEVTLHVGLGTFAPIEVDDLSQHKMHAESFEIAADAVETLRETRAAAGRIVAVGTTSVRVLESLPELDAGPASGWTDIFIYPPYCFRHVDRLLTNFHLPGSTLLALVMAFAGADGVRAAYQEAIARAYRFYSYGDAMLIV
jgi:S-adenosylmethionine:tRNA ribosyltransferase-isomerase